ncbi:MAG TPA: cation diffusion facilitator family transporter [Gemmatimonadales bacterium]|nr:cation diffusion facilitator family transporter [Gemmatimonadales bacterium]
MPTARAETRSRTAAVRRVLIALLAANLAVVAAKLVIGLVSGSLAVLGDALHSTIDALNNVLALVVIGLASKAPDEDHPYGHGKFETLGALGIVGFMSITCFELIRDAVARLAQSRPPPLLSDVQLAVLLLTLAVNVVVAWYEHRRGVELESDLLLADAAHTRADVFITISVLGGLLLAREGLWWADPALALVITAFIVRIAYRIFQRTVPVLVDQRAIPDDTIRSVAESVRGVKSAYGIRSRGGSGAHLRYAEVTIGVDPEANVAAAHAIADEVERRLKDELHINQVTVHVEPC